MKKLSKLILIMLSMLVFVQVSNAQTRYVEEVFDDVLLVKGVKYSENYSVVSGTPTLEDLLMDVYMPKGDNLQYRPVIILLHAGSFLPKGPFLPFGTKEDSSFFEMGIQLAKRGFIAASVGYRIGWNPLGATQDTRSASIINAVYRAMQDARSAVRYFRKDAATTNYFKADPYRISVGGSNSGGYVSLAVSSMNKISEINLLKFVWSSGPNAGESFIDQSVTGGFYGEGGASGFNVESNQGYSSTAQCILNLGGAVGDTSWMEAGEAPIVAIHGIADPLTPFYTDVVIVSATGDPVVEVSGSADVAQRQNNIGNNQIWIDANFSDPVTGIANTRTPAYEGLFWYGTGYNGSPPHFNGYEPWAWYDTNEPKIIDDDNPPSNTTIFPGPWSGFGSAANPYASRAKAEVYIDSVFQYFIPRLMVAFDNIDTAAVDKPDSSTTPDLVTIDTTDALTITVSIEEITRNTVLVDMDIYPNPASEFVSVILNESVRVVNDIFIYGIDGKVVRSFEGLKTNNITLPLNNLNSGIYIMNIEFVDGDVAVKKLMVD